LSSLKAVRDNHESATRLTDKEQGEKGSNVRKGQLVATFLTNQDLDHDHTSLEGPRTRPQVQRVVHIMLRRQIEAAG